MGNIDKEDIRVEVVENCNAKQLKQLVEIEKEAFGDWGYNEWALAPFIRYGKVFALYYKNDIAGLAIFFRKWSNPDIAYLASISVKKLFRGMGLGSHFLQLCLEQVKDECEKVKLHVDPSNKAAYKIYFDHFGFEPVSFAKDEYGKGMDRIVMELDLEPLLQELGHP